MRVGSARDVAPRAIARRASVIIFINRADGTIKRKRVDGLRAAVVISSTRGWGRTVAEGLAAAGVAVVANYGRDDVRDATIEKRGDGHRGHGSPHWHRRTPDCRLRPGANGPAVDRALRLVEAAARHSAGASAAAQLRGTDRVSQRRSRSATLGERTLTSEAGKRISATPVGLVAPRSARSK